VFEKFASGEWQNNTVFVSLCSGIPPCANEPGKNSKVIFTRGLGSETGALPWKLVSKKLLKELRNGFH
jgi:hypothetical protein